MEVQDCFGVYEDTHTRNDSSLHQIIRRRIPRLGMTALEGDDDYHLSLSFDYLKMYLTGLMSDYLS